MKQATQSRTPFTARPLASEIARMFRPGAAATAMLAMPLAFAAPQGGAVTAGQAAIQQNGSITTITQGTQRAAIDWRAFNVGSSETVNFVQPNASSAVLNRVVGNEASAIFGRITANGQVYLVNPNGVVFGRSAQVDVGALTASTANISNADFMAGRLAFSEAGKPGARVENQGSITVAEGGFVALVGRNVANSGLINARLGKVALAGGDAFVLDLYGDKLVNLIVDPAAMSTLTDASGNPLAASVDLSGQIVAEGGRVQLSVATVKQLVDSLINVSGVVRATSFTNAPGQISLHGDANTRVVVSGTLDASAGEQGNGGKVDVLSDGSTQFTGRIEARGGAAGGDGGQVEVSAKGRIGFMGDVDVSAAHGAQGSLLIDPTNLRIATVASGDSDISADQLRFFLARGTNVTLAADQNVVVDAEVNGLVAGGGGVRGGGLTLTAGNNLIVNNNIALNDGALTLTATNGTLSSANGVLLYTGTGAATLSGGAGVNLGQVLSGGAVDIRSSAGAINVRNALIAASADGSAAPMSSLNVDGLGAVSLNGALVQGNATVRSRNAGVGLATAVIQSNAGNVQVNAGTTITTATNNVGLISGGTVNATAGQSIDVGAVISTGMATLTTTSGGVTVHQAVTGGGTTAAGGLTVNAGGPVVLAGVNAGAGGIAITSSSGNVTSQGATASEGGLLSAGGITVHASAGQAGTTVAPLSVQATAGNVQIDGNSGVSAATLLGTGIISVDAAAGGVTVSSPIAATAGVVNASTAARPTGIAINARDNVDISGGAAGISGIAVHSTAGSVTLRNSSVFSNGGVEITAQGAVALLPGAGIDTATSSGFVNVSAGSTLTVGNAGIRANADGVDITMSSVGNMQINGDVQTKSGRILLGSVQGAVTVASDGSGDASLNATLDAGTQATNSSIVITAATNVDVGEMIAFGSVQLTSTNGNVVLHRGLGGNASGLVGGISMLQNTGYTTYDKGYQAQYRPNVGRLAINAPLGSVEFNGVNIDGNANATDTTPGLQVIAGRRIVSNNEIAVNKGDIELTGGSTQATDGVYLGSSVYSRGFDSVGADGLRGGGDDQKTGYGIRINGRVLGLFDNTVEMAQLPVQTYHLVWYEAGPGSPPPSHYVRTDPLGFIVDAAGLRVRNPDGSFQQVGYLQGTFDPAALSLPANGMGIYNVTAASIVAAGNANAGLQVSGVMGQVDTAVTQEIAKIEVANNVANYQDAANAGTLVAATTGTAASRKVQIGSSTIAGVGNHTPQTPMRLTDPLPTLVAPSQTPIVSAPTDAGVTGANLGIGLKVLGFKEAGDASSFVWSPTLQLIAADSTTFLSRTDGLTGLDVSSKEVASTIPVDGVFSITTPALATRTYTDTTGHPATQAVVMPAGAGTATITFQTITATPQKATVTQVALSGVNTAVLPAFNAANGSAPGPWVVSAWQPVGAVADVRLVSPTLSAAGTAGGVSVTSSIYPAVAGTGTASPVQTGTQLAPNYTLLSPAYEQPLQSQGIEAFNLNAPRSYQVTNILSDVQGSGSRPGTRVFVYDGIIDLANGAKHFDSNTGVAIPGLGGIPGFNNSTVGFAGVGAGFGALVGGSTGAPGVGGANGQGVGGAAIPGGQSGVGAVPTIEDRSAQDAVGSGSTTDEGQPGAADVFFGSNPSAQADLGRGAAVPGSAANVFKRSYRLATTTSGTVCVPNVVRKPTADGKPPRECPAK
ncbi:MAG: filamentous hemagglutinin N-terminal domain-containing protein [Rhizobacter sp.]